MEFTFLTICDFLVVWLTHDFRFSFFQDLAKELIDIFKPVKMGKVFFCNTGSEANDTQVIILQCNQHFLWNNRDSCTIL